MKSHSGPTWIIKSEPRPGKGPPRRASRPPTRKVVERLYTADCARREAGAGQRRPTSARRRGGGARKKAVRSFLSRLRRSDVKRKKRLKAIRDAVFAAERGVERTAEDAVGLQNLSRLAAARSPPPPTLRRRRRPRPFRGPRARRAVGDVCSFGTGLFG